MLYYYGRNFSSDQPDFPNMLTKVGGVNHPPPPPPQYAPRYGPDQMTDITRVILMPGVDNNIVDFGNVNRRFVCPHRLTPQGQSDSNKRWYHPQITKVQLYGSHSGDHFVCSSALQAKF